MCDAVLAHAAGTDLIIMAAAIADYTPAVGTAAGKMPKGADTLTLELRKTTDILTELGRRRGQASLPVLIGFAAETGDPLPRARQKLATKAVDMIVANDVSAPDCGFDVDTNAGTLVSASGEEPLLLQSKSDMARVILDRAEALIQSRIAASVTETR
jgi:phosphopantothenoylcysteine decarboxylase/phosphopantothenate--cysteine ligase